MTGAIKPRPSQESAPDRRPADPALDRGPAGLRRGRTTSSVRTPRVDLPSSAGLNPGSIPKERCVPRSTFEFDDPDVRATLSNDTPPATAALPARRRRNAIEIRQLRYFVAAVEAGSLRSAESRIGVSQPAMTRQIHQLEEELGVELLVRRSRGIRPTDAGRVLFEDAVRILAMFEGALLRARPPGPDTSASPAIGRKRPGQPRR